MEEKSELIKAINELKLQNEEKAKCAAELAIANKELAFQNEKKEKRAAELVIANKELQFQNDEKEKRAAELVIANKELEKAERHIRKLYGDGPRSVATSSRWTPPPSSALKEYKHF